MRSRLTNLPDDVLDFAGGPGFYDDECIYDAVDDATAQWLLNDWLDCPPNLGWDVNLELAKLLAKRGHLVRDRVEPIIRSLTALRPGENHMVWAQYELCLSFLPRMEDGESLALRLLGLVPEDFRDGLLHACYSLNTPAVYEAVKTSVRRWADDFWCGDSTGERWLVARLVERWDTTFPDGDHADIRLICQPTSD